MVPQEQPTLFDDPLGTRMAEGTAGLARGDFSGAATLFDAVFGSDPEYPGVDTAIRTAGFWSNRAARITALPNGYEKGRFLKEEWDRFVAFLGPVSPEAAGFVSAARTWIFREAMAGFILAYETTVSPGIELVCDIGDCYREIGEYALAIETFEYAWELKRDSSQVLARLADTCEAWRETPEMRKRARLFFREAFLYNPAEIELERIRAGYIRELAQALRDQGYSGREVHVWLPIQAAIRLEFSIKRELDETEVQRLYEEAYALERKLEQPGNETRILLPLLLNRYIWLIDHYQIERNDAIKVEILKKKFQDADAETCRLLYGSQAPR